MDERGKTERNTLFNMCKNASETHLIENKWFDQMRFSAPTAGKGRRETEREGESKRDRVKERDRDRGVE